MKSTKVLLGLSIVVLVLLVGAVAVSVHAQSVEPDRVSFYNVPGDAKLESHIDYADGHSDRIRYGDCVDGAIIEESLNLYRVRFVVEGCTADVHQHLNLRTVDLAGCVFDFEHDPDVRITFYGAYGQVTITGHYEQGEVTLPVPTGTISMTVVMSHTEGVEVWTGNVEFLFDEPQGCVDAPATVTPTPTETPTPTPTEIVVVDDATPTPTEVVIVCCPSTPATPTPTPSPTELVTPTATPTEVIVGQQPTGEQPVSEPGRMVWLPVVSR